jgi:hypothetical protein
LLVVPPFWHHFIVCSVFSVRAEKVKPAGNPHFQLKGSFMSRFLRTFLFATIFLSTVQSCAPAVHSRPKQQTSLFVSGEPPLVIKVELKPRERKRDRVLSAIKKVVGKEHKPTPPPKPQVVTDAVKMGRRFRKARQQPKNADDEAALAAKCAAIDSVEDRAFQVLQDLGMTE